MPRRIALLVLLLAASPAAGQEARPSRQWPSASQRWTPPVHDCTCRAQGRDFRMGESVCLNTASGARLASCGMILNNSSWDVSDTPCSLSALEN